MPLKPAHPLHGLVAAAYTPFHADGSLNLAVVEKQAEYFSKNKVGAVFIGGTTGECHSLTVEERRALAQRWFAVARGADLKIVVHVGSNCLADARNLASQAEALGTIAVSAMAPSYFKPSNLDVLIACCAEIASAAPATPFYFYDIPSLTGVSFPMPDFLARAPASIPTLAGIKFTNTDLMAYQFVLHTDGGKWDVPFGVDQQLLGALVLGARGAVGSGYNFAAPLYQRLLSSFFAGDLVTARAEQFRGAQLTQILSRYGYMAASKAYMGMLDIPVGPPRLPIAPLSADEAQRLRQELQSLGVEGA